MTGRRARARPLPAETIDLIVRVLGLLAARECRAVLVGACAVAVRSGVATRPVRDVDIYCAQQSAPVAILSAAGLSPVSHSKLVCGQAVVDIVHPDLARISRLNKVFLDYCMASQKPVPVALSDGTPVSLSCPTTPALLALKLCTSVRRTMWLTRRHDLFDAWTLIARRRGRPL